MKPSRDNKGTAIAAVMSGTSQVAQVTAKAAGDYETAHSIAELLSSMATLGYDRKQLSSAKAHYLR